MMMMMMMMMMMIIIINCFKEKKRRNLRFFFSILDAFPLNDRVAVVVLRLLQLWRHHNWRLHGAVL